MIQLSRWKVYVVAAALLLSALFAFPNLLTPAQRDALPGFVPSGVLNLGLDLQGGSYLMLQVDVDEVRETRVNSLVEDMRVILGGARIAFSDLQRQPGGFTVTINDPANYDRALSELQQLARPSSTGASDVAVTRQTNNRIRAAFTDQALNNMGANAVDQSIEVVRRRIDSLGTREPSITRQGTDRIVVQAPGESDPEALERVIGQTAQLTFQMVDHDNSVQEAVAGRVPPDAILMQDEFGAPLLIKRRILVSGESLTRASVGSDQSGRPAID
ncbi:MAG: protein translocase subunit SecD, partial [Brevundimonas sp.]